MLKLYDYFRSSACFRVRIALNLKELKYDAFPIHLINQGGEQFSKAYEQINPQCLIPTLQIANHTLTQSLAIMEYLDEMHPNPPLLPKNTFEKALVRSFALSIAADIHPLNNLRVLNYLSNEFAIAQEQKTKWYHHWLKKGFDALETQLTANKNTSDFCFGNHMTLADICLVPQMYNARRFNFDLNDYPTLVRIDAHCQQHDAVMKAFPEEALA